VRIVGVTMARNEVDIIEAWVRHHARLFDELIVLCHFCQDETQSIVEDLVREGLPLEFHEEARPTYDQGRMMTELAREAVTRGADLVFPLDADEFVVAPEGDGRAAIERLPVDRLSRLMWRTYVPFPQREDEPNVLRRLTHRPRQEGHPLGKVVLPGASLETGVLSVGSHELPDRQTLVPVSAEPVSELVLAHFSVRSEAQLRAKVLGGWPVSLANPQRTDGQGGHWRDQFLECRRNGGFSEERLQSIALGYAFAQGDELVEDPIDAPFEIRYAAEGIDPEHVFNETIFGLADEVRRLSAPRPPFAWRAYAGARRRVRGLVSR